MREAHWRCFVDCGSAAITPGCGSATQTLTPIAGEFF
jgi:hypothetical protein